MNGTLRQKEADSRQEGQEDTRLLLLSSLELPQGNRSCWFARLGMDRIRLASLPALCKAAAGNGANPGMTASHGPLGQL